MPLSVTAQSIGKEIQISSGYIYCSTNLFIALEFPNPSSKSQILPLIESVLMQSVSTIEEFKQYVQNLKEHPMLDFAAAFVQGAQMYTAVFGEGMVAICRGTKILPIIKGSGSVSGQFQEKDSFLLLTKSLHAVISQELINEALQQESVAAIVQLIDKQFSNEIPGAGLALLIEAQDAAVSESILLTPVKQPKQLNIPFKSFLQTATQKVTQVKPLFLVVMLLGVVLVGSIGFGFVKKTSEKNTSQAQQVLGVVSHKFEEGMALIDLNPIRARELLQEADAALGSESAQFVSEAELKQLTEYKEKIAQGLVVAERKFIISPSPFFELDLLKIGGKGARLALYQDALFVLDTQNALLYRLSIVNKSSKIIARGDVLKQAKAVAAHGEDVFALSDRVYQVEGNNLALRETIAPSAEWQRLTDIKVFGGNIYLLDPGKNWVWKYFRTETGYGTLQDYFLFDTLVDISQSQDMAIDGSVWIAMQSTIRRFSQGSEDVWRIKGLAESLGTYLDLYVDDTTENLYILDRNNQRVVVLDKNGTYLAQYLWKEGIEVTDFVVSEVVKKILLLSHGTIYAIDIR